MENQQIFPHEEEKSQQVAIKTSYFVSKIPNRITLRDFL